jgi:acyl-CoA synthetase (AMP-forming)/AMP-acid ligase II
VSRGPTNTPGYFSSPDETALILLPDGWLRSGDLNSDSTVSQFFVFGVPDDRWGEIGCAYVVAAPGCIIDPEALMALCREKLAKFKQPRAVMPIAAEDLPTTPTGKVQKFRLVDRAIRDLAS